MKLSHPDDGVDDVGDAFGFVAMAQQPGMVITRTACC
jgi:hypothetical protein